MTNDLSIDPDGITVWIECEPHAAIPTSPDEWMSVLGDVYEDTFDKSPSEKNLDKLKSITANFWRAGCRIIDPGSIVMKRGSTNVGLVLHGNHS